MPADDAPCLLVVRQRPVPHPELERLVAELQTGFALDPYTARQRLLGPGLAQLIQGQRHALAELVATLRRHGYPCWLIPPARPRFVPPRLRTLAIGADAVEFHCEGEQRVRLERGAPAVGVLADLSGELAGRQVKRLLARNAYLGREHATLSSPGELRQAILKGQPVFDCYLCDAAGAVTSAFRVLPGRFNPEGLGGRASLGAVRNLEAVVELVGEYAGRFRLHSDFGLSPLPGCQPRSAKGDPTALAENLDALTRYGWLVAGLDEPAAPLREQGAPAAGTVLAGGVAGMAVLAGEALPGDDLGTLTAAVNAELAESPVPPLAPPAAPVLPPPPDRPAERHSLRRVLPVAGSFLAGVLLAVAGSAELFQPFLRQAVHTGALPALAAIGLCWGGFACLRLRRWIEDTPTSRIRSLAMGLVEVHGRALRRHALVAPMTHSACVWYRLSRYRRDRNNRWTLSSQSDSSHVPFVLDDGSGRLAVDPAGAAIRVKTQQTGYPGQSALIGAAVEGGPDEKWVEELIFEGTTLYVLGYARPVRPEVPGLRARTVEALRQLKLDPHALRRYDANGDGRLDADEWQVAREDAERLAAAAQLEERSQPADRVLLGRPPRGLPFLIAETHEEAALARRYGWIGGGLLLAGLAAFGLAVKLSLTFFNLL